MSITKRSAAGRPLTFAELDGNFDTNAQAAATALLAAQAAANFQQAGTGAVSRTVQDKMRESVSVLDFGADPTGVADSTAAIQAAINSMERSVVTTNAGQGIQNVYQNGGTVFLPPGVYKYTSLVLGSGVLLAGASQQATVLSSTLTDPAVYAMTNRSMYQYPFTYPTAYFLAGEQSIENLTVQTAGASGIFLTGGSANFANMRNVNIFNNGPQGTSKGLRIQTVADSNGLDYQVYFLRFDNVHIENFYNGYYVQTNDVKIIGGVVYRCEYGIDLQNTDGVYINTSIQKNTGTGSCIRFASFGGGSTATNIVVENTRLESSVNGANGLEFVAGGTISGITLIQNNYQVTNQIVGQANAVNLKKLEGNQIKGGEFGGTVNDNYVSYSGGIDGASANGSVTRMYGANHATTPGLVYTYMAKTAAEWALDWDFTKIYSFKKDRWTVPGGITHYALNTLPTSGTFNAGDVIWMINPTVQTWSGGFAGLAGAKYTLLGWRRITTGAGNVLNTDWVEMRQLTGL